MFGTLPAPCGKAPAGGVKAVNGVKGVTADSIKIGVISDKAGAVKVPTASVEESVKAFVEYCNDLGGIDGRKLELSTYDAQLTAGDKAATQACNDGLFALVGTGVVQDDKMAQVLIDCDLLNVAGYTATGAASLSKLSVTPVPNPFLKLNVAPGQWIAKQYPDAVKKAAMLASDIPVAALQRDRVVEGYTKAAGFDFTYQKTTQIFQTTYSGEVAEMRSKGIEYVSMVSATSETNKLLKDMKTAGWRPEVIDLGQQYYDSELLTEPGAEGAYVQTNTLPFEEADQVPALKQYLDAYAKVGSKIKPTSLGVQSFSAGLLFATAAKAASESDTGLTRDELFSQLKKITKWDGGGLHFTTSPGTNEGAPCFLYLRVKDGKFVREFPKKVGTFECGTADQIVDVSAAVK
ncbi:MAG: ABC transporter substrate-binding protein [Acidimicrobiales bacterium]|nr:ABC transporter substrate-binding protein [Acidimicrobiales bacterium]